MKASTLSSTSLLFLLLRLVVIGFFTVCATQLEEPCSDDAICLDLKPADFRRSQLLGEGSFGDVYKVKLGDQEYALKVATMKNRDNSLWQLKNERRMYQLLQHKLIPDEKSFFLLPPKEYGSAVRFKNPYERRFVSGSGLLLPLCPYQIRGKTADLFDLIREKSLKRPLHMLQMAAEIARSLKALHRVGVIHGDIKAENVLLKGSKQSELSAVLTDFGSSWIMGERDSLVITHRYASPERVIAVSECAKSRINQHFFSGKAGDIYSFAVLLVVMLNQDISAIDNINLSHAALSAKSISAHLDNLIGRSLSNDPKHRPRIDELVMALDQEVALKTKAHKFQYGAQLKKLLEAHEMLMSSDMLSVARKQEMTSKSVDQNGEERKRLKNSNQDVFGQQQKRTTSAVDASNNDNQNEEAMKNASFFLTPVISRVKGTPWEKQIKWRNSKENEQKPPKDMLKKSNLLKYVKGTPWEHTIKVVKSSPN